MKIALLIAGYSRSLEINIENIKKYIIENNEVDIYLHVTRNKETKYFNRDIDLNKIIESLNPKYVIISENINFNKEDKKNDTMNQNYKFFLLNEERKRIAKFENIKYKMTIKTRPDVYLNSTIYFSEINLDMLNIPSESKIDLSKLRNRDDPFLCDILAFGSPEIMNQYFDFFLDIEVLIKQYGTVNETLLYYYLKSRNILYNLINVDYIVILSLFNTVAVTGDSGSGKTTITNILKTIFKNSFLLECDRYHKWERDNPNWGKYTHLNPDANFIAKMQNDVFDLKIGNDIYQIDYNHDTGKFTDKVLIESKENIIVCGLHSLYLPDNIINLKIYMDTDDNLRIPWKIKRDILKRGYTIEKIFKQIEDRKNDFEKYIKIQREKADIIVCLYTDDLFDLATFDLKTESRIFLKIGLKLIYDVSIIIKNLNIKNMEVVGNFYYMYFEDIHKYEYIIKTILLNLKQK